MSDRPQGTGRQASGDKSDSPSRTEVASPQMAPYTEGGPTSGGPPPGPKMPQHGPGAPGAPSGVPGVGPSPDGEMPPATPPGGRNRTPLFIVVAGLAAAILVGSIIALSKGDDGRSDQPNNTGDTPGATPAISVLESGFSSARSSYGLIVENNSDQVAAGVPVTVAFLDDSGTLVGTVDQNIGVLLPGQKMGLGEEPFDVAPRAAAVQVTVGEPSSWEAPGERYGEITVGDISTNIDGSGLPTTTFSATSSYGEQIDAPYAYAVYRNSAGQIVGGSSGFMRFLLVDAGTAGEVTASTPIPDLDTAKTEVYIDPGFMR